MIIVWGGSAFQELQRYAKETNAIRGIARQVIAKSKQWTMAMDVMMAMPVRKMMFVITAVVAQAP